MPTCKETDSIQEVIRRSGTALAESSEEYELVVVDDNSGDGTAELAEELSGEFQVRVLRRPGRLGLATTVVDGWKLAQRDLLGVIDADLQHPPEILKELAAALRRSNADLGCSQSLHRGRRNLGLGIQSSRDFLGSHSSGRLCTALKALCSQRSHVWHVYGSGCSDCRHGPLAARL